MSNTRRTREGRLGKFTRPKEDWTGHKRNRMGYNPRKQDMNTNTSALSKVMGSVKSRAFGANFRRKSG